MPYNGNVEIVGGLVPKNNANFKLINVKDIYYSDDKDLLDVLGGFEEKGVKEFVTELVGVDDTSGLKGRIASLENNAANVTYVNEVKALAESKASLQQVNQKIDQDFTAYSNEANQRYNNFKTEVDGKLDTVRDIAGHFKTVNSEHIAVETDAEGHILEYTDADGHKHFTGRVKFGSGASFYTASQEYLDVKIDANNAIVEYTDLQGNKHFNGETFMRSVNIGSNARIFTSGNEFIAVETDASGTITEYTDIFGYKHFPGDVYMRQSIIGSGVKTYTMSPYEYMEVKLDGNHSIVEATLTDGTKYFPCGLKTDSMRTRSIHTTTEYLAIVTDQADNILEGTFMNGDKLFTGNVYSKNLAEMNSALASTVSTLNYVTKTLYENNIIPEQPEIVYSEDEFEYDYMP